MSALSFPLSGKLTKQLSMVAPSRQFNFLYGTLPAGLTYTNSSTTRTYFGVDGLLKTAAANEAIFEYDPTTLLLRGMRWEMEQRTNLALWNRDLTNGAWTSTNGTPLKNQAGLDGVANSASSFTATAGNATCLQSITSASAARVTSFYLKRLVGAGAVEITQNNGTTWTAVTLTSAWQRFQVTSTLANPVIGIRVVTNGDSVALDFAQHESGSSAASSPIPTTTASVIRQPDVLTAASVSPWFNSTEGTVLFEGIASPIGVNQGFFAFSNGTSAERFFGRVAAAGNLNGQTIVSSVSSLSMSPAGVLTSGAVFRAVIAVKENSGAASSNGGSPSLDPAGAMPASISALRFGSERTDTSSNPFMGYARRWIYYPRRILNEQVKALSA